MDVPKIIIMEKAKDVKVTDDEKKAFMRCEVEALGENRFEMARARLKKEYQGQQLSLTSRQIPNGGFNSQKHRTGFTKNLLLSAQNAVNYGITLF